MKERNNRLLRFCDTYIGIPLIFLLGLFRLKHRIPEYLKSKKNPRIVLLKTAGIGDTVLVSTIVRELKHSFPGSHITFICTNTNRAMAEMISEIDQIVIFNLAKPLESFKLIRSLARFDLMFDCGPWPRVNSIISYLTKSSFKVGFKRRGMFRHYIYDKYVLHSDRNHETDNYRNLLKAGGIDSPGLDPILKVHGGMLAKHGRYFSGTMPNIIMHAFSAGSRAHLKEWPSERWAELGIRLADEGFNVLISGGKKDAQRAEVIAESIERRGRVCTSIAGVMNLREMAAALKKTDLLISIDTGIMHLGAGLGTPIVAMFGPTSPERWGPRPQTNALILRQTTSCKPCLSLGFEDRCTELCECMQSISVEMVYDAAMRMLAGKNIHITRINHTEPEHEWVEIKRKLKTRARQPVTLV